MPAFTLRTFSPAFQLSFLCGSIYFYIGVFAPFFPLWLAARGLDPALPVMRAHGVPGLIDHLQGKITRAAAVLRGQMDTRHYAKRQFTFARHQLSEFQWLPTAAVHDLEG